MHNVTIEREGREPLPLVIEDEALNDMELFEALTLLDDGNATGLPRVIASLLGKEQKKALYDYYRGENGRVKVTDITEAIMEIFNSIKEGKN